MDVLCNRVYRGLLSRHAGVLRFNVYTFVSKGPMHGEFTRYNPRTSVIVNNNDGGLTRHNVTSTTYQVVSGPLRHLLIVKISRRTRMNCSVFSLLTLVRERTTMGLVERTPFTRDLFRSATLNVNAVGSNRIKMFVVILTARLHCFVNRGITFFRVAMDLGSPSDLAPFLLKRRLFKGLPFILFSRTINHASGNLNKAMILLRLRSFNVKVCLNRVRGVIGIHSPRKMSTLHIITRRTCALVLLYRLRRSTILYVINILVLISGRVTRLLTVTYRRIKGITRGSVNVSRRVIRVRYSNLPTALPMTTMSVPCNERLYNGVTLMHLLINYMSQEERRIILHVKSTYLRATKLVNLLIGPRLFSSKAGRTLTIHQVMGNRLQHGTSVKHLNAGGAKGGQVRHARPGRSYALLTRLPNGALLRFANDFINRDRYRSVPKVMAILRRVNCLVDRRAHLSKANANSSRQETVAMRRHHALTFVGFFSVIKRGVCLLGLCSQTGVRRDLSGSRRLNPVSYCVFERVGWGV